MRDTSKNRGSKSAFTRRAFFKGSSAVAATAALQGQAALGEDDQGTQVVSGSQKITLQVNGEEHQVSVEPRDTLLDVLRYQLELTGAKPVSSDGSSGASTVMIDGKPMAASTMLAVACAGKEIVTVEGLVGDEVPAAFVEHDAQQCGFCTPGFVVAVRAFLNKNPNASREEIQAGLNGNICRCGTYANVVEAVVSLAKGGK